MPQEHYLSKIERNANVLHKAPENIKDQCLKDIIWARDLAKRLDLLDYHEREKAIANIHHVMDDDYQAMGFELEQNKML